MFRRPFKISATAFVANKSSETTRVVGRTWVQRKLILINDK